MKGNLKAQVRHREGAARLSYVEKMANKFSARDYLNYSRKKNLFAKYRSILDGERRTLSLRFNRAPCLT